MMSLKALKSIVNTIKNPLDQAKKESDGKKFWTKDITKKDAPEYKKIVRENVFLKSFIEFLEEGTISGSGIQAERHKEAYLDPHVGSKDFTHSVATAHGTDHPEGSSVKLHKIEKINGSYHALATNNVTGKKSHIPVTKLNKPGTKKENKGHDYESKVAQGMKMKGLMASDEKNAGSGSGTDFYLHDKRHKEVHKGQIQAHDGPESDTRLNGEAKAGKTAAFGQLTIAHDPKKGGWHIPDEARAKRPEYASHIEKATVNGKPLLQHMNEHSHPDKPNDAGNKKATNVMADKSDLAPANAYLRDHHVHVLQVGGHGAYKVGDEDKTGMNLPKFEGKGQFRVRQKTDDPKKRTVQFMLHHANKSHVNFENEDHVNQLAKNLGHDVK